MAITFTEEFRQALDLISAGRNVLISGKAGTGKSTLLREFLENTGSKKVLVTAPTGVAALNIEGFTIHRAFGFRPSMVLSDLEKGGSWHPSTMTWDVLKKTDILVVDEISMVRADLFDMMDQALCRIRGNGKPFGGVQLVLVGDLLQLPPVVTPNEAELFNSVWETPYFFSAQVYARLDLEEINLTQVWRQADPTFIDLLNEVREGRVGEESLETLNQLVAPDFDAPDDWVTLTSRKSTVARINRQKLANLPSEKFVSVAEGTGDLPANSFSGEDELHYAEGARVMTVINDPKGRFVNGSFGQIVRATGHEIDVRIDATGEVVTLAPHTWEINRPGIDGSRLVSQTIGTIRQFPVILAWAITIHKSQGKTIPKLYIDLAGGTSTDGQFYVALSRAVDLEHLRFSTPVEPRHIRANNALVRRVRREVSSGVNTDRVVLVSFNGVNFGMSEHVARIHAIVYQNGNRVASFGSWINPMADLGEFGQRYKIPVGGLAMAPTLGDFWPLLLRQAQDGIVVGDRLAMLERAVRHQEKGMDVALGIGYEVGDFSFEPEGDDVVSRCESMAVAYENGTIAPSRGQLVPRAERETEGAVLIPSWAPKAPMILDQLQATDSDNAWAAMSGGTVMPRSFAEVEECAELLSAWAVSRGLWTQELYDDIQARVARIDTRTVELPAVDNAPVDVPSLLVPGTRIAFTGRNELLGGPADDERLDRICRTRRLEYKKGMSKTRCDVLVARDVASMSRKAQAAREFGKPIISQDDFEYWYEHGPFLEAPAPAADTGAAVVEEPASAPVKETEAAPTAAATGSQVAEVENNVARAADVLSPGTRVAFRGSTIIDNQLYPQGPVLQEFCAGLGLVYKQSVTKTRCDVLVTDDLTAQDGKASLAVRYNKPLVKREDFAAWAQEQLREEEEETDVAAAATVSDLQAANPFIVDDEPSTTTEAVEPDTNTDPELGDAADASAPPQGWSLSHTPWEPTRQAQPEPLPEQQPSPRADATQQREQNGQDESLSWFAEPSPKQESPYAPAPSAEPAQSTPAAAFPVPEPVTKPVPETSQPGKERKSPRWFKRSALGLLALTIAIFVGAAVGAPDAFLGLMILAWMVAAFGTVLFGAVALVTWKR
ncbi:MULTISPECIES: AAA family ATPase [unclassified Corynebacterium]|uniref:AAA family ATPase n=2 Tax=Corynebacterium TaxID=1716 RepID=UPI00254A8126|nr:MULTISPECIES: AAA family ATPase [unclassified Corynebacterium]MDK8660298.1 AAA family ATPase [Corynebacterium sp. MSK204]MDK8815945.1 AAA family ATPase [Corynebacterium sp. MSK073]